MNPTSAAQFTVSNWRPFEKNTLRGFMTLTTPAGLVINGVTLHEKGDSRWLGMPARQFQKDGVTSWAPVVEFSNKGARDRFQTEAMRAVAAFLDGGE